MHQLVQSAIDATQKGDRKKAFELLKQVLTANPSDVDALLALEDITAQPERKRQILDRVLRTDPVNRIAREKLTNLDRLAMGSFLTEPQKTPSVPVSATPTSNTSNVPSQQSASPTAQPQSFSASLQSSGFRIDKPIVFRFPFRGRVGYFIIAAIFGCIGLLIISQGDATSLSLLCMGILFGLAALSNQSSVTLSESGIRTSNLFSKADVRWNEIASMKPNILRKKLELVSNNSNTLKISTQIDGYPALVEILRQKRPDLFSAASSSSAQKNILNNGYDSSPSLNVNSSSLPAFTGVKTFNKNFFGQYGVLFLMLPLCIVGPFLIYLNQDWFAGIALGLIGLFFMIISLFNINQVKLESNKLTAEAFFHQKEYTAKQIKEISMKTVRSRRGIATNFVHIQPVEGNAISMAGFPEGEEIIYGTLMDWWNTYRTR